MKKWHFISSIIFVFTCFLILRLFFLGTSSLGDAPYFFKEGLSELWNEPTAWTSRGINLGGINSFLWISPLMIIYGFLGNFVNIGNDTILSLLFYIPSFLLTVSGGIMFARHLKQSAIVQLFTAFFLVLNTYYLLIIDGGQVGIVLAYGLFPWLIICIQGYLSNTRHFVVVAIVSLLLSLADPRIFILGFILALLWWVIENGLKNLKKLIPLLILIVAANLYWILPLQHFGQELSLAPSQLKLLSLLNGITFYQPHWSANEFGKVTAPPFYFIIIPILILIGTNFKKRKSIIILLLTLLCMFFLKGETDPAGGLYHWFITSVPFAGAFRDSSKFFIPLILLGGIGVGKGVEVISSRLGLWVAPVLCTAIVLLIYQAPLGQLPMVLSSKNLSQDYQIIYEKLRNDSDFFRTVWFPEKHPHGFATNQKPSLDAKSLVTLAPLGFLNAGGDVLNFMNNKKFTDWFSLLGVKYLIVDKDPRKQELTKQDFENNENLLAILSQTNDFKKVEWGTDAQIFQSKFQEPHIWGVEKLLAVVGDQSIYQKLEDLPGEFHPRNQAIVFLEDGLMDAKLLGGISSEAVSLVFHNKSKIDLTMSFLKNNFVDPKIASSSQWASGSPGDYLSWKYELLIRKLNFTDFFYNKNIAYSSNQNEKITIPLNVTKDGPYRLAVRAINIANEGPLIINFAGKVSEAQKSNKEEFKWTVLENLNLKEGRQDLNITNVSGIKVLNVVALIPDAEWQMGEKETEVYLTHFPTLDLSKPLPTFSPHTLTVEQTAATRYKVQSQPSVWWAIFTDSYHPLWNSLPAYSMVNALYLDPKKNNTEIVFEGQTYLRWGFYWTAVATLASVIALLYISLHENRRNS